MTNTEYEFLLGRTDTEVRRALAAVAAKFGLATGVRRRETRVWLDTFDARLRAAGLRLAQHTRPGSTELILTGPDIPRLGQAVTNMPRRWLPLDALPAGAVRERLAPVVGVRALLPRGRVAVSVQEVRVLNADEKTVVRARLERAAVAGVALPVRITLVPVRGYQDQAERVAKILTAVPGVIADPPAEADLAAPPRPKHPVATTARRDQPAAGALAGLLLAQLDEIELNVPGTIDDIDTEFLHDLRVAVRRTRSALKLAGDALPGGLAEHFAAEFKWLGDLTTPARDLDVFLLEFDALAGELTEADPADLAPLREYLREQRAAARRRLVRGLRSARMRELTTAWRAALAPPLAKRRPAVGELAADRAGRAWRRLARRGAATGPASPPATLHDLRKRGKELRYVLELFAGAWEPAAYRELLKELKVLQDCLGEFQDAEVHRDKVRGYAAELLAAGRADAPALLAMGELVAGLGGRQRRAAAESVARVGRFLTDQNRRRVRELVRA